MLSNNTRVAHLGIAVGLTGTTILALSSLSPALSHGPTGWGWWPVDVLAGELPDFPALAGLLIGLLFLLVGWWMRRPRSGVAAGRTLPVFFLWAAPLLVIPPVWSADAFAYADAGWILKSGLNPYEIGLGGAGGPYAESVDPLWLGGSVAWPPVSLLLNRLGIEIMGTDPYWGVVGQRVVVLVGVIITALILPRIADAVGADREWAQWFGILNPIVIVHYVGGAHMDAFAVTLVIVAIYTVIRGDERWFGFVVASVIVGVAIGVKQYSGLAVVAVAGIPVSARLRSASDRDAILLLAGRVALSAAVAVLTFALVSLLGGFGFGWAETLGGMYDVSDDGDEAVTSLVTLSPAYLLGDMLTGLARALGHIGSLHQAGVGLSTLAGLVALVWLTVRKIRDPLAISAWGSLIVVLTTQAIHPWYLGMPIALVSVVRINERTARLSALGAASYVAAYTFTPLPWVALVVFLLIGLEGYLVHRAFGHNEVLLPERPRG